MSRLGVLAEGEELWSNPLCVVFQRLRITYDLLNLWETADSPRYGRHAAARPARPVFDPDLEQGGVAADDADRGMLVAQPETPAPLSRLAVRRHDPKWEPGAVVPLAGICAGAASNRRPYRDAAFSMDYVPHKAQ
jgi:hypothetical protein